MTNYLLVSMLMIASCSVVQKDRIGKVKSVTILGNSIVSHAPLPEIGWLHDWGMAASSRDKDFVHLLMAELPGINVKYKNIAAYERGYRTYALSQLDSFKSDMVIIRISENVITDSVKPFMVAYNRLIDYFPASVVVLVDGFWASEAGNQIKQTASDRNLAFVLNSDLNTEENKSTDYTDPAIREHPSDAGMRAIKNRIWDEIKVYFL